MDLAPVKRLLAGGMLPIVGDDPRSEDGQKVFSAAPVRVGASDAGYVYVVLQGQAHDALAMSVSRSSVLRTTLWSIALVALLGLVAGLTAFALITRPLRALTRAVSAFEGDDGKALAALARPGDATDQSLNEISVLRRSFVQMGGRISDQWRELTRQDQQRRDLVANISHDLRTPLTSLHGYLETLRLKDETLDASERRRYLDIALAQSRKVGRLAQELFELARLESGLVRLEPETFSLPELVQDVMQKFELAAEARQQELTTDIPQALPLVRADLGLIERVLTNLLDNAIRHSPPGSRIALQLGVAQNRVQVQVSDTGKGIPPELRSGLFTRGSALSRGPRDGGGLGLVIVQRILQLHQSEIRLVERPEPGAVFQFDLSAAR
ncbi:Adaptive-response sensory-kinase SasA [compost metagenome]